MRLLPPRCAHAIAPNGREGRWRSNDAGFTLVELVVAVVVLATGFMMAALTNTRTMETMVHNLTMSDQESLIDEDLGQIRRMAEEYTWCSGAGTLGKNGNTCATNSPLTSNYYFPNNPPGEDEDYIPPPDTTEIKNFTNACNNNTLTQKLIAEIGASTDLAAQNQRNEAITIRRTVSLAYPSPTPESQFGIGRQTHLLRVSYRRIPASRTDPVERDVLILPTVAAWCP